MEVCFRLKFFHVYSYINKVFWFVVVFRKKVGERESRGSECCEEWTFSALFPTLTLSTHSTSYYFSQPTVPLTNPLNQLYPSFTFSTHFFSHSLNTSPYSLIPLLPSLILLNHSFLHLLS